MEWAVCIVSSGPGHGNVEYTLACNGQFNELWLVCISSSLYMFNDTCQLALWSPFTCTLIHCVGRNNVLMNRNKTKTSSLGVKVC